MQKKIHLLLIILLVFSVLLAGCSSEKNEENINDKQKLITDVNVESDVDDNTNIKEETSQNTITEEKSEGDKKISSNEELSVEESQENQAENDEHNNTCTSVTKSNETANESVKTERKSNNSEAREKTEPNTDINVNSSTNTDTNIKPETNDNVNIKSDANKQKVEDKTPSQTDKSYTETANDDEQKSEEDTANEEKQKPTATSVFEKRKNGLSAFTAEELKILLDEIYPGDNLTQHWIDTLPSEKLYEYFGQKYSGIFYDYVRTSEKIIDNSTVECDVTVRLSDGGTKKHKVRLKMDDNLYWSVISDDLVQ